MLASGRGTRALRAWLRPPWLPALTLLASSLLRGSSTAAFCFTLVSSFLTLPSVDLGWMGCSSSDSTSFSPAPAHRCGTAR